MKSYFLILPFACQLLISNPVYAVDDDDCAIWLCLPVGFAASGCSGAKSAFKDRIKHFKPPLPSLPSCMVSSDSSGISAETTATESKEGKAAFYYPYKECVQWRYSFGHGESHKWCSKYEDRPQYIKKDSSCPTSSNQKQPCKNIYYAEVMVSGELAGETFYYDYSGNTYTDESQSLSQ